MRQAHYGAHRRERGEIASEARRERERRERGRMAEARRPEPERARGERRRRGRRARARVETRRSRARRGQSARGENACARWRLGRSWPERAEGRAGGARDREGGEPEARAELGEGEGVKWRRGDEQMGRARRSSSQLVSAGRVPICGLSHIDLPASSSRDVVMWKVREIGSRVASRGQRRASATRPDFFKKEPKAERGSWRMRNNPAAAAERRGRPASRLLISQHAAGCRAGAA